MVNLYISERISIKLRDKHGLTDEDIHECFSNRGGIYLEDTRHQHKTDPKTQWFIALNNKGQVIKVVFMLLPDNRVLIKSAFLANKDEINIYVSIALKKEAN